MTYLELEAKAKSDAALKTLAATFVPALDDAADCHNEEGRRRRALDLRELANVWNEIGQILADEARKN
jgi:hypothetical protein